MFPVIIASRTPVARLLSPQVSVLVETVRGRKSRHDPIAKSKEGRIKYPPPIDPVEMVVMKERFKEYVSIIKALRFQFKEEMLQKKYEQEVGFLAEGRARQEAEEHCSLMAWNDAENRRLLRLREQRILKERDAFELQAKEDAILREQKMETFIKEKEMEILQLQEEAKNFITLENLDQRIEEAMDNPKNYNFAIDKEGRVVKQTMLQ